MDESGSALALMIRITRREKVLRNLIAFSLWYNAVGRIIFISYEPITAPLPLLHSAWGAVVPSLPC